MRKRKQAFPRGASAPDRSGFIRSGFMKIGDAARVLNVSTRTLRFYEELGILTPARTAKGARLYAKEDVELAQVTQRLSGLGVALREIAELATIRSRSRTGDQASHKVFALLGELRRGVEGKRKECEIMLEQIEAAARLAKRCFGCENPPTHRGCETCPVARNVDKSRLLQLIWDKGRPGTAP